MAEVNGNGVKPHTNGPVPVITGSSYAAKFQLADHFIGGNKLENAPASAVKDFVASHDGHTVITNVRINPSPGDQSGRAIADVCHQNRS